MSQRKAYTTHVCIYRTLILIILMFPSEGYIFAQIKNAWAVGDGEKVFRNDENHPSKNGNNIWDGNAIRLKGLYNEVLAFQLIIEAEKTGVKAVEISVTAPVERKTGKVIGGTTLKYGPQGTIEVFSEHYLNVTNATHPNWFYGSAASAPKKMTGWIPDALIPEDAMPGMGGFPLNIPAVENKDKHFHDHLSQNQGFWIDIHMPRDQKNFPPGVYYGSVKVLQAGATCKEFPLELTLLPFYLPEENQTNVWLYSSDLKPYFPDMSQENIDNMIKFEAHRHRVNMSGGFSVNTAPFNRERMDQYKAYLDGSAFTPGNGYNGPGEGTGEKIFPIAMYGGNALGNTEAEVWRESDLWVSWFNKNAPEIKYFWYIIDEPGPAVFPWIMERSGWLKNNPGIGKTLPVFTTSHFQEALSEHIDIWAAYDGVDLEKLPSIKKKGGDYWFYNGNRPRIGSVILEGAAVDYRVNSWILYKYGISQWFVWETTHWKHNHQGPKGNLHQNIFIKPLTFINDDMEFGNGDGVLFYPGRMPFYPEQDRGLNQLLPSIRLKNIRRGQQDAAIMWMAEQKAGRDRVLKLISTIVPKAMSEVDMKDKVQWSENGSDYDKVRDELINLL